MPYGSSKSCPTNRNVPTRHHRNLLQFPQTTLSRNTHTHTHTRTHTHTHTHTHTRTHERKQYFCLKNHLKNRYRHAYFHESKFHHCFSSCYHHYFLHSSLFKNFSLLAKHKDFDLLTATLSTLNIIYIKLIT